MKNINSFSHRSERFPERDIWFLGTLDQGPAKWRELLGRRRRRHLILPGGLPPPETPPLSRPAGLQDSLAGILPCLLDGWRADLFTPLPVGWLACSLVYSLACWMAGIVLMQWRH